MELAHIIITGFFALTAAGIGGSFGVLRGMIKTDRESLTAIIKEVKFDLLKEIEDTGKETSKCEKTLHKRMDKFDIGLNAKMSKGGCIEIQRRIDDKFDHMRILVDTQGKQNSKDHDALMKSLCIMDKKQDATNEGMAEMITCLALLSENIPCTPGKGKKEEKA